MALYLIYMASPVIVYFVMNLMAGRSFFSDERWKKAFLITCGIIMFLMIGLRSPDVGSGDTRFYYENWENMSVVSFIELQSILESIDMEQGYMLSVWALSHVFPEPQMLLVITAAFFAFSVCRFVSTNSENPLLSIVIFNCLGLFNFMVQGQRQAIAMCICLFAVEQCKSKHFIRFFLLVVLACLFHASAIVFIVVWFLSLLKLDFNGLLIFGLSISISLFLLPNIFEIMNRFIEDDYTIGTEAEQGGFVAILIYIVIIAFAFLYKKGEKSNYSLFLYMTIIGLLAFILRNTVSAIAERVSLYFAFGQMIILPNSIDSIYDENTRIFYKIVVVVLCLGVSLYKATYAPVIPYYFYWMSWI